MSLLFQVLVLSRYDPGLSLLVVVMSTVIATIAVVTTHQLSDRDARITPADAFTIISLISAVRFVVVLWT